MIRPRVVLLPGNGYAPVRLEPALAALERAGHPFELVALPYPPAADLDELLDRLASDLGRRPPACLHATGIGGLVALALRLHGHLRDVPVTLEGAVLWGLELRRFPRLMRLPGAPRLLTLLLRLPRVRRRFAARHFEREHSPEFLARFFAGYRDAAEFARWFRWLDAALLRDLEARAEAHPERLDGIQVWWGERDRVVGLDELRITESALGRQFPLRRHPAWGHYPMIDAPEAWVAEVAGALDAARPVR